MSPVNTQNAELTHGAKLDRETEIQQAAPVLLAILQPKFRPIARALLECSDKLLVHAFKMLTTILDPTADEDDRFAAAAVLADILYPNPAEDGHVGLDLAECESDGSKHLEETRETLTAMDLDEATFAERLGHLMASRQMTQEELASKIGVGQPAISMMLNRNCRPQRKTVIRLAEALSVSPEDLWPGAER